MQLSAEKGVRYTGGRYEFDVEVVDGSFRDGGLGRALEIIASEVRKKECYVREIPVVRDPVLFNFRAGEIAGRYALMEGHNRMMNLVFYTTDTPRCFKLKAKCEKKIGKTAYNHMNDIFRKLLGDFKIVEGYDDVDAEIKMQKKAKAQQEPQQPRCEQLDLFQPAK